MDDVIFEDSKYADEAVHARRGPTSVAAQLVEAGFFKTERAAGSFLIFISVAIFAGAIYVLLTTFVHITPSQEKLKAYSDAQRAAGKPFAP